MQRFPTFLYLLLSLVSQLLVGLILGVALFPAILFLSWVWARLGGLATPSSILLFSLSIGFAYLVFGNALLLVIIVIRNLFGLRSREVRGKVVSVESVRTGLYNLLLLVAASFYLAMLKSSYFNQLFYRGMGAKIGKGTIIATHRLWDCDLIEIGENCIIGGNSSISAHYAQGQRARLRKVRIGNSVTIGANTSVMPGVVIDENVIVGANSLVPMGMHLASGGIYVGVPVERVN